MIILEGPDGTGKTTLARIISNLTTMKVRHFTKDSTYGDYMKTLLDTDEELILDRFIWSEYAYATTRRTDNIFRFSLKQFHNATLLCMMRNPLIIMCTHKPDKYDETILPKENWSKCMQLYLEYFATHRIEPIYYDYDLGGVIWFHGFPPCMDDFREGQSNIRQLVDAHNYLAKEAEWWKPLWKKGIGPIGSQHPKLLIVAERLGPHNVNNLPFETGPTGYMLSDALGTAHIPLNSIAITNLVKDVRGSTRRPNSMDMSLLSYELDHLKPKAVLLMGSVSKSCMTMLSNRGTPYIEIAHLGSLHRRGLKLTSTWVREFRRAFDLADKVA